MTVDIAVVLLVLAAAIILFITEKIRVDVVALLLLGSLVVTRLVTPEEAVSGFSNSAVITVWAVFILSGALAKAGIANRIGKQVLTLAGDSEIRLLVVIMVTAGVMSAFMNNIGVAALLLPVIIDISRQTGRSPSKLLMPLVYGALLGGTLTLIGTPPNILVSDALRDAGLGQFGFFDFAPVGAVILLAGTLYMVLVGRHMLPARDPVKAITDSSRNGSFELFELSEVLAEVKIPVGSVLAGMTLAESRIGRALGLNTLAVMRNGRKQLAPRPETILQEGDGLLVLGRLDRLEQLSQRPSLIMEETEITTQQLLVGDAGLAEFRLNADSPYSGRTLAQLDIRRRLGVNVLAIRRGQQVYGSELTDVTLMEGDRLLVQGEWSKLESLQSQADYRVSDEAGLAAYDFPACLLLVGVPEGSILVGRSLAESRLGQTFGLTVLTLTRGEQVLDMPDPDMELQAADRLLVKGMPRDLAVVRGLQELDILRNPSVKMAELTNGPVALVEAVLSPYSSLAGKSLRDMNFRERYGLNVLAIWRAGRAHRSNLGEMALRLGDALLLYGPREKIKLLGSEADFLVMHEEAQEVLRLEKAPIAGLLMLGVIGTVLLGWLPISIAAVIGATLMVVTGCLDMEEAYRYIEWKAVFLIAGMLPLGIAMEQTGAADFLATGVIGAVGGFGPRAVLGTLFLLAMVASVFMPNPVVAVLMAPIAISSAADLSVAPFAFMMAIAVGASASFLSPVGHPANVLVMGPGGYRFTDYIKVGFPLVFILLIVVVAAIPLFWPFATG